MKWWGKRRKVAPPSRRLSWQRLAAICVQKTHVGIFLEINSSD
jgi:hypothetical protein